MSAKWYVPFQFSIIAFFKDPKRHLEENVDDLVANNVTQGLGAMLHSLVYN